MFSLHLDFLCSISIISISFENWPLKIQLSNQCTELISIFLKESLPYQNFSNIFTKFSRTCKQCLLEKKIQNKTYLLFLQNCSLFRNVFGSCIKRFLRQKSYFWLLCQNVSRYTLLGASTAISGKHYWLQQNSTRFIFIFSSVKKVEFTNCSTLKKTVKKVPTKKLNLL